MIKIYGTSHIAQESYQNIEEIIENENSDLVAVELDRSRLKSLLEGKKASFVSLIPFLMQKLQAHLGKKTGVMPGEEMLKAVKASERKSIDLALIDQPIQRTINNLMKIPLKEKIKLVFSLLAGFIFSYIGLGEKIDLRKVPEEEFVDKAMKELKERFPMLYEVIVEDRNWVMAQKLKSLDNKYNRVIAFVGAGHKKGINKLLDLPSD